jgi:site-specific recombinase XerD
MICRAPGESPKTIAGYASFLRYFASFLQAIGHPDTLGAFTLAHARRYSQELSTRGAIRNTFIAANGIRGVDAAVPSAKPLKANTLFGYLRPLKTFGRWLADEDQGYLATDVMRGLKLPRRPQGHEEPLTEAEMGQLVAGFEPRRPIDARNLAICLTFLATGIRASELTGLLDADVHLDEAYLRVKRGKGGTSRAIVVLPEIVAALYRYRQHHRPASNAPHFFINRHGGR